MAFFDLERNASVRSVCEYFVNVNNVLIHSTAKDYQFIQIDKSRLPLYPCNDEVECLLETGRSVS